MVALALILTVVLLVVRNGQVMNADEGAVLIQAQVHHTTGGWVMHPDPHLDPTGKFFGVHLGDGSGTDRYPFVRPPIYPLAVGLLLPHGGLDLVMAAHLAALLVAALGVGMLTEHLRQGRGVQAFWLAGLLSPLFFDGYWVIAHVISAAAAVWATYAVLRLLEEDTPIRWVAVWLGGLLTAVVFRNEAALFGAALAFGTLVMIRRDAWRRPVGLSAVSLMTTAFGYEVMKVWQSAVKGWAPTRLYSPTYAGGWLDGRVRSIQQTILSPSQSGGSAGAVSLLAALLVIAAVVALRSGKVSPSLTVGLAAGGVALSIVRLFMPADLVSGLLMAAPLIVVAAVTIPIADLRRPGVRLIAAVAATSAVLVAATQSGDGGGSEWGGRYFHVALPLVIVLAALSLDRLLAAGRVAGRVVLGGLAVSLLLSVQGVQVDRAARRVADTVVTTAWNAADQTSSARQRGGPVIVSTWVAGGRFSWQRFTDGRLLTFEFDRDGAELARNLRESGVDEFVLLVTPGRDHALAALGGTFERERTTRLGSNGWQVVVVRRVR